MKKMGLCLYIHKSSLRTLNAEELSLVNQAIPLLHENFSNFSVIKVNKKDNSVTFIKSYDFDSANEPTVGDSVKINADGTIKLTKGSGKIYHHKWMFVTEDYTGFDVLKSKERSALWECKIPRSREIKSRIQSRTYWNKLLKEYDIEI